MTLSHHSVNLTFLICVVNLPTEDETDEDEEVCVFIQISLIFDLTTHIQGDPEIIDGDDEEEMESIENGEQVLQNYYLVSLYIVTS